MARSSTISAVCVDENGDVIPYEGSGICYSTEHDHKPNPEWWITEDGYKFKVGDRLFNYYDCEWGVVVSEPRDRDGWFYFKAEGTGYDTSLNSVRVSKNAPSWYKEKN